MEPTVQENSLEAAARELIPLLVHDVRRLARRERLRFRPGETLQTTALVNEAYLKLAATPLWNDRNHFLRAASLAMRQIITDMAKSKLRHKRGSGAEHVPIEDAEQVVDANAFDGNEDEIAALDEALIRLAGVEPRLAELVQCRYFGGYTEIETAAALGISERTLRREWVRAKAWLYRELKSA